MEISLKDKSIIFFDLDYTLYLYNEKCTDYHNSIINLIKELKFLNKKLILISYNIEPYKILKKMKIIDYFDYIIHPHPYNIINTNIYSKFAYVNGILYEYPLKSILIKKILDEYGLYSIYECIFFDDNIDNIIDVKSKLFINSVQVNSLIGIEIHKLVY